MSTISLVAGTGRPRYLPSGAGTSSPPPPRSAAETETTQISAAARLINGLAACRKSLAAVALSMAMLPGLAAAAEPTSPPAGTVTVDTCQKPPNQQATPPAGCRSEPAIERQGDPPAPAVAPNTVEVKDTTTERIQDGTDDNDDIKPVNENGAFLRLDLNRRYTLLSPLEHQSFALGPNVQASYSLGGANLLSENSVNLSEGGVGVTGFTPQILSQDLGRINVAKADIHENFFWGGNSLTLGANAQADLKLQVRLDPLFETEMPAHPKKGAALPMLFEHQETLEGTAGLYARETSQTRVGTFSFQAKGTLETYAWTEGNLGTTPPPVSPRFSFQQGFTPQGVPITLGLQEDWRPVEHYQRYAIQATHPVHLLPKVASEVGIYAGRQTSNGKTSEFIGAGLAIHF